MEGFSLPDGAPKALVFLVYLAVTLAAAMSIWKSINGKKWKDVILRELQPDGGKSMKDLMLKTSADSKQALDKTEEVLTNQTMFQVRIAKLEQTLDSLTARQTRLEFEQVDTEKRMARFIIHEVRNSLNASNLRKEAEKILEESEKGDKT